MFGKESSSGLGVFPGAQRSDGQGRSGIHPGLPQGPHRPEPKPPVIVKQTLAGRDQKHRLIAPGLQPFQRRPDEPGADTPAPAVFKGGDAVDVGGPFPVETAVEPVQRCQQRSVKGPQAALRGEACPEKQVRKAGIPEGLGEQRPEPGLLRRRGLPILNSHGIPPSSGGPSIFPPCGGDGS